MRIVVVLTLSLLPATAVYAAPGTTETVHVATPGTLEELIFDLESTNISSLTVTGCLDAYDIQYLITPYGKMGTVEHLDISAITLQPGDHPYAQYQVIKDEQLTGGTTGYFYISDTYNEEFKSVTSGWGGSADQLKVYSPYLDGAFAYTNFKSIVLPDFLDKIPQFMFKGSTKLESITMKRPLTEIGQHAFYASENLKSLPDLSSLTTIGERAFERADVSSLNFSNTSRLKTIGWRAFEDSKITSINLSAVESMGALAFGGCSNLTGMVDLRNLNSVPEQAFSATAISGVSFSNKLREIGKGAFSGTNLTYIVIPEGTTSILDYAFGSCRYLENVSLPQTLITLSESSFIGTPYEKNLAVENGVIYINNIAIKFLPSKVPNTTTIFIKEGTISIANNFLDLRYGTDDYNYKYVLENITSLSLPSTLKKIGERSFTSLPNLGEVSFPDGLQYIGESAFIGDSRMSSDKLPESLKYIGRKAFEETNFTQVTLPENLEYIGGGAFAYTNISSVKVYTKNLPIHKPDEYGPVYVFSGINAMKVYIGASVNNVGAALLSTRISDTAKLLKVEFEDRTTPISFGDYCFRGDLTVVNFPSQIAYVGEAAFSDCSKLNFDLSVLTGTNYIGKYAFDGCTALTGSLVLNCDTIRTGAFRNTGVESVTVGHDVKYIYDGAFADCANLKEFHYNATDCSIPYSMFAIRRSVIVGPAPFSRSDSDAGMTVYIGKNVKRVPDNAFTNVSALVFEGYEDSNPSVITEGSFSIGAGAFMTGSNMQPPSISPLPTNTVSIGQEAFYLSTNEAYVPGTRFTVPASVKEIGLNAFSGYEELYMYPLEAPVPDDNVGYSRGVQRVYVRPEALESYLNVRQHWQTYEVLVMPGYELEAPTSITFPKPEIGMQVGWNLTLTPNILPDHALNKSLTWTSSNPLVATVDQEGEVTSHARGTTTITATSVADPNVSGSCVITVTDPDFIKVQSVKFKGEITLSVGDVAMSGAIINPTNATEGQLMYIADDPDIVKVIPSTGKLYGLKAGTTTLRVLSDDQQTLYASTTVIVAEKTTDPFDITGDGNVDVTDVVNIVDKIIHKTTEVAFHDLNNDGKVDVADIVVLVSHILNGSGNSTASRSATAIDVPVSFDMSASYTAMQTDIVVAEGSAIEDVAINAAIARSHTLAYNEIEPGRYRVIVYSPDNRTMALEAGEPLFTLSVAGSDTVTTEATMFVEAEVVPTGINGITDSAAVESVTYFDLQGRRVSAEARGILIERTVLTDGTVVNRKIRR